MLSAAQSHNSVIHLRVLLYWRARKGESDIACVGMDTNPICIDKDQREFSLSLQYISTLVQNVTFSHLLTETNLFVHKVFINFKFHDTRMTILLKLHRIFYSISSMILFKHKKITGF